MIYKEEYSFWGAWRSAVEQTWRLLTFNMMVMVKMIVGKISIHTLGGPITVFQAAGKATQAGFQAYLDFIGFISLTIGFINLLPIPGLDGGHLFFR
ncbi:site-2 protease family protein [Coxiella-like endosymbiont]|uniref:site-2 protease family protein n=1 Tax=Coxiella-like endosymbiont TaxID=1592897 RepID=UPI00272A8B61|nr:site-2 protease family protein [Coxiella-like endosymbiont]